jgi:geranylgeranyl diphosphate synthase type II
MDDAPLRRGQTTVHEKWDLNTGILSGDMLILAYQYFEIPT